MRPSINNGKWLTGFIVYADASGDMVYAVGPRGDKKTSFHMMPYYSSKNLQEQHGPALKRFFTGKSCIEFTNYADLPGEALVAIVTGGAKQCRAAKQAYLESKKSKSRKS